jgi:hypothetical protein
VLKSYPFTATGNISLDLDGARAVDYSTEFEVADLLFFGLTPEFPQLSIVGYGNRALTEVDEPTFDACVDADYPTPGTPIDIPADETTYLCVDRTDQESRVLLVIDPVVPGSGLQNMVITVWQRGQG